MALAGTDQLACAGTLQALMVLGPRDSVDGGCGRNSFVFCFLGGCFLGGWEDSVLECPFTLAGCRPPQPEVGRAHVPLGAEAHVQGKVLVSQVVTGHRSLYQRPTDLNLL